MTCARCRRAPPAFDVGRAAGIYAGTLRAIVHAFKYRGRRSLALPLARLMRAHADALLMDVDWLVPVPLYRSRERRRGFNQAEDLARALARVTREGDGHAGIAARRPHGPHVLRALRRVRDTQAQSELPASRRHRNVRDAFALAHDRLLRPRRGLVRTSRAMRDVLAMFATFAVGTQPWRRQSAQLWRKSREPCGWRERRGWCGDAGIAARIADRCVLLVDDVSTTGATLDACARVLKAAGAREVRALTAARAVRTRPGESPAPPLHATVRR